MYFYIMGASAFAVLRSQNPLSYLESVLFLESSASLLLLTRLKLIHASVSKK